MDNRSQAATAARYQRGDVLRVPLGARLELFYCRRTQRAVVAPAIHADALGSCNGFRTLTERALTSSAPHGATGALLGGPRSRTKASGFAARVLDLLRRAGGGTPERNPAVIPALAGLGLMVPEGEVLASLRLMAVAADRPPRVAAMGIPTRNRPRSLQRAVQSYLDNLRSHGRVARLVVIDASDEPARGANLAILRRARSDYRVDCWYVGPQERERFGSHLIARGGFPRDAIDFALGVSGRCGGLERLLDRKAVTTGASLNALLLHAAGEMFVSVDDDSVCRLAEPPESISGLRLCSDRDPTALWFFPDRHRALDLARWRELDFLKLHEQLLGKDVSGCASEAVASGGLDLAGADPQLVNALTTAADSVTITMAGLVGDSGTSSRAAPIFARDGSWARLVQSAEIYRAALCNRAVLRAVRQCVISDNAFCMSGNLGLDNRRVLPPFFPVFRNHDGLFAACARACRDFRFTGFLPYALEHDPPEPRCFGRPDSWSDATVMRVSDLMCLLAGTFRPLPGTDGPVAIRALGGWLSGLAAMPLRDFRELLRVQCWQHVGRVLDLVDQRLRETRGVPEFWAQDLRGFAATLVENCARESYIVPIDLDPRLGETNACQALRSMVALFARLLCLWPDIVQAARDLRSQQIFIGTRLI